MNILWRDLSRENVLRFVVFERIIGIRLKGSGYLFTNIVIHSNGLGCLFGQNCHPFELLGLSIRKKMWFVRTVRAIRLKKNCHLSKLWTVRATEAICSKINFSRVSIQKTFCRYSHSRWTICYFSRLRMLQSLFTIAFCLIARQGPDLFVA